MDRAGTSTISPPSHTEIREQLRVMLSSPAFHGSRRCQQFLEYVTAKALAGDTSALKEKTIAIEVFGRDPAADLLDDTIVRVSAREVRKRLAQYYVTPEGVAAPIRIELPPGAYAPEFRHQLTHAPPVAETPEIQIVEPATTKVPDPAPPANRKRLAQVGGALAILLAGAAYFALRPGTSGADAAFKTFWDPVLKSTEPLLLIVANPLVYHPSKRASQLSEQNQPLTEYQPLRPLLVPPEKLNGNDIVPVFNQYVGVGDMVAATEVTATLARQDKAVRVRISAAIEFADLRRTPVLLIGGMTNRWTVEMQKHWRFQFSRTPAVRAMIVDTVTHKEWAIPSVPDGTALEDYVLLSRLPNTLTGGVIMVAAGLKQFGTEAGGRLLADRNQLGPVLSRIPAGWESKNMQVVLRVHVIGNAPAQPEIVAWHVW